MRAIIRPPLFMRRLARFGLRPIRLAILAASLLAAVALTGCPDTTSHAQAIYMLLDTSGTYQQELDKAQAIVHWLLARLQPGDSLAVGRIDTASFSEKDLLAKVTFDSRPSTANDQKRAFLSTLRAAVVNLNGSPYTDITGGILQAAEFIDETGAGRKTILVFSDMQEELKPGYKRDFPMNLAGISVVALNVTKLRNDQIDPRKYQQRLEEWRARVEQGGGSFLVVNDLERLERIFGE
ncbi:von Willebrand factor type A domain containing protein [Desulfocurvibacter africanus PCS]|uniref:von Willebrand factor type A domain containing protein n=1 Tax=Desulfocurvibacter africanus PCS TaxID=1262666 RepID=M5PSQ4_DESAF|nr:VWA domain-containing protein [Desulfocurvibacter africanus]EMG37070.1 von Willebrand factor type A domain containing protein [Desulfocurvibacter africanus PCS]